MIVGANARTVVQVQQDAMSQRNGPRVVQRFRGKKLQVSAGKGIGDPLDFEYATSTRSVYVKGKRMDFPRQFCALYLSVSTGIPGWKRCPTSGVKCHDTLLGLFSAAATSNIADTKSIQHHLLVRALVFRNNVLKSDDELIRRTWVHKCWKR